MAHHCTNETDAYGNTRELSPAATTISADISDFLLSPAEFLATRPDVHNLVAGAMVFRSTPDSSSSSSSVETLLLRRAPSDSFPLKWEIPAGTADPSLDDSIIGVAVRELWEETHLRPQTVFHTVGLGLPKDVTNLALIGEAEDARMDSDLDICLLRVSGLTWAIVTFLTDIEDEEAEVILREDEHVESAWVTETEVQKQFYSGTGQSLDFVSEAMRMTVLEGFRLRKDLKQQSIHKNLGKTLQYCYVPK
ncbi:hypothetical protein V493_08618 [Pseudogymnoascus sp. VKM F-4281 (FW-2241)]|nr:hypothetical protein V493_08618 [Pseudogymnoascus sp. VKM F-4281 (FW-2241)]